jgi:hypothetical protein
MNPAPIVGLSIAFAANRGGGSDGGFFACTAGAEEFDEHGQQ